MSKSRGVGRSLSVRYPARWKMVGTIYISQTEKSWVIKYVDENGKARYEEIHAKDEVDAIKQAQKLSTVISLREVAAR